MQEIEFLKPTTVSILSERRSLAPNGMAGGGDGQRGLNLVTFADSGRTVSLGGNCTIDLQPGDRIRVETPGGGGWGKAE